MKVSLNWLRDYIDIDLTPETLAHRLTMAGLEVESISRVSPGFTGVVVAKIRAVRPHPQGGKLSLCEVATGSGTVPIVCGAPNVREGILVPLAKVGATIPGGYTIKSSRIRGELSEGMLCSEEELGIGEDAAGIMVLPETLRPGQDLAAAMNLEDTVLEVSITPNRPDCLSILGIAREVAALTGARVRYPETSVDESEEDIHDLTSVAILDPDLCPRYTARMVKGVTIAPSPGWMRLRLEASGMRAINNAVDVTNFVMLECGQPLHAFDFRFLEEGRIVVRGSRDGEEFTSLDEKVRTLDAKTLMICDGVKPVAIAGIMGGLNSEVKEDTETILLESAYFTPSSIRRSSKRLGLSTEAAYRFERGIDPEGVLFALNRSARLLAKLSGGRVCRGLIDAYPKKVVSSQDIPLRVRRVNQILGTEFTARQIRNVLKNLGMTVTSGGRGVYAVTPPTARVDLVREIDLVEEVARISGYETVPVTMPPLSVRSGAGDEKRNLVASLRNVLSGSGYSETISYSFISPQGADILNLEEADRWRRFVRIRNPLAEDFSVLRTNLLYGLLLAVKKNVNAGNPDLKLFETGNVFYDRGEGVLPEEEERVAGIITGLRCGEKWNDEGREADFYDLKGVLERVFQKIGADEARYVADKTPPFVHSGRSCRVVIGGDEIGFLGEIHPDVLEKMDLHQRVIAFELDLAGLARHRAGKDRFREIPRFPAVSRDVALLVDRGTESAAVLGIVRDSGEKYLESAEIFDVYEGQGITPGLKSMGVRITYRSAEGTLTDETVSRVHQNIVDRLVAETKGKVRGT